MKGEAARPQPSRLAKCLRKLFRFSFSSFGMLIIVFMYLVFGGFLFQFLENKKKIDSRAYFRRHREECIQELWSITKSSHVLYKQNWTLEALDPLRKFEVNVIKEMSSNHKLLFRAWSFTDSLFYSVTILTTIGYNSHTPNTSIGKVATILYATFGIPLMLLFICNVGFMLSDLLQFGHLPRNTSQCINKPNSSHKKPYFEESTILKRDTVVSLNVDSAANRNCSNDIRHIVLNEPTAQLEKRRNPGRYGSLELQNDCSFCEQCSNFDINCEWCKQDIHFQIREQELRSPTRDAIVNVKMENTNYNFYCPTMLIFLILIVYIFIGAFIYSTWKDQPFADGAYFCFLTLTTIGSCDIFKNIFSASNEIIELLLYSVYLLLGLSLTSAFVLLLQKNVKIESSSMNVLKFRRRSDDEVAL